MIPNSFYKLQSVPRPIPPVTWHTTRFLPFSCSPRAWYQCSLSILKVASMPKLPTVASRGYKVASAHDCKVSIPVARLLQSQRQKDASFSNVTAITIAYLLQSKLLLVLQGPVIPNDVDNLHVSAPWGF